MHILTTLTRTADSGSMPTDRLPNNQGDREVYLHDHHSGVTVTMASDPGRDEPRDRACRQHPRPKPAD
jgi:hypothetical protein